MPTEEEYADQIMSGMRPQKPQATTNEGYSAEDYGREIYQSLRGETGQEILKAFAGQVDLGEPGMPAYAPKMPEPGAGFLDRIKPYLTLPENTSPRMAMAAADTREERMSAFKKYYPKGDLVAVPMGGGGTEWIYREDPSKEFRKVDAGLLEKFEPAADIGEFLAGDAGALLGELAATARTRGMSLAPLLTRLFAGAGAGEMGQELYEKLKGYSHEELSDILTRAGQKGVYAAGGGAAGRAVEKGVDVIKGGGTLPLKPGAERAMRADRRLDAPDLLPHQMSTSPIVRRLTGQAQALLPQITKHVQDQERALAQVVRNLRPDAGPQELKTYLRAAYNAEKNRITSAGKGGKTLEQGGEALVSGRQKYDDVSRAYVTDLYNDARTVVDPIFNIDNPRAVADDVLSGVKYHSTDAKGKTVTVDLKPVPPAVAKLAKDIRALPDVLASQTTDGRTVHAYEMLDALRQRAWELKTPPKGEIFRQEHRDAAKLFKAINEAFDEGVESIPGMSGKAKWKAARKAASERFDILDHSVMREIATTETPRKLAERYANPGEFDNLKFLRTVIPTEQFNDFKGAFRESLIEGADNITERLKEFDTETLDLLLSPREQTIFRTMGENIDELNALGATKAGERQVKLRAMVSDLIQKQDTGAVKTLNNLVFKHGGKDGPLGRSVRAGILEDFYSSTVKTVEGTSVLDLNVIDAQLARLKKSGAIRLLKSSDVRTLRDVRLMKDYMRVAGDAGTSLQAASAVAEAREFSLGALRTIAENIGIGRIMINGRSLLTGTGGKRLEERTLSRLSAALATSLAETKELGGADNDWMDRVNGRNQ